MFCGSRLHLFSIFSQQTWQLQAANGWCEVPARLLLPLHALPPRSWVSRPDPAGKGAPQKIFQQGCRGGVSRWFCTLHGQIHDRKDPRFISLFVLQHSPMWVYCWIHTDCTYQLDDVKWILNGLLLWCFSTESSTIHGCFYPNRAILSPNIQKNTHLRWMLTWRMVLVDFHGFFIMLRGWHGFFITAGLSASSSWCATPWWCCAHCSQEPQPRRPVLTKRCYAWYLDDL